jgi:transposase InsO family protein
LAQDGVRPVKLPAPSPNPNAHAERFVRSIKSECLAQIIPLGERYLWWAVKEYTEHYHQERNHQGLDNQLIEPTVNETRSEGPIECRKRLGGVLNYYYRPAT